MPSFSGLHDPGSALSLFASPALAGVFSTTSAFRENPFRTPAHFEIKLFIFSAIALYEFFIYFGY